MFTFGAASKKRRKKKHSLHDDDDDDACSSNDGSVEEYGGGGESTTMGPTSTGCGDETRSSSSGSSGILNRPIAYKETLAVHRSKLLVYLALILAATAVGTATFVFITREDEGDFANEYNGFAREILDVSETNAAKIFGELHSLSTTLTSYALSSNSTWPRVTLPHFDIRAAEAEELSGAELIAFAPLVHRKDTGAWERYAVEHQSWIESDLEYRGWDDHVNQGNISKTIYPFTAAAAAGASSGDAPAADEEGSGTSENFLVFEDDPYQVPVWQLGPVPTNASIVMVDLFSHPTFRRMIVDVMDIRHVLLSEIVDLQFLLEHTLRKDEIIEHPRSFVLQPVFDDFVPEANLVGFLVAVLGWETYFEHVLAEGVNGFLVDIKDSCGSDFTYMIDGPSVKFIGEGDLHDPKFDEFRVESEFAKFARYDGDIDDLDTTHCEYTKAVYPTDIFHAEFETNKPGLYTAVVVMVFVFTAMVFVLYDCLVQARQRKVQGTAERTKAIVSSLFPKNVQKRIMEEAEQQAEEQARNNRNRNNNKSSFFAPKAQLKSFLHEEEEEGNNNKKGELENNCFKTKPIADLFPHVTIMFADIVGFTAWSSMREPSQVFTLLESIYHRFDEIAKRRRVFKVETVGDCYVAVAGLPDPRKDHAIVTARFARDCLYCMNTLTKQLEVALGPDTAELGLRLGLHSGPVTAGVLRGERARFQLFGDTVNTTARLESTGAKNKIHISQETADCLVGAGKGHWIRPRHDVVNAKGKGELKTYWLELRGDGARSARSGSTSHSNSVLDFSNNRPLDIPTCLSSTPTPAPAAAMDSTAAVATSVGVGGGGGGILSDKHVRLVDWNTDMLKRLLAAIVAQRQAAGVQPDSAETMRELEVESTSRRTMVLDEVQEIIRLPKFNARAAKKQNAHPEYVELSAKVVSQLHDYAHFLAAMYRDENPFHNFEHASHVTMSVVKLLTRIVAPDLDTATTSMANDATDNSDNDNAMHQIVHDHTFGITSDPLTQFAVVLSALIHDVDHTGVPNSVLVKERANVAEIYQNKSVAEQNSVDIAWDLLMESGFDDLRRAIYATEGEFKRFRQLVVNSVMATDIMDRDLGAARKERWNKAFAPNNNTDANEHPDDAVNRKATIVIEHLIQASDVAHTMQHWHIYRKHNARLFKEMYKLYRDGRIPTDPAEGWYTGEMGFFDHYVIPLAMKLRSCGVFGVSSDEYLNYAKSNRAEWERKGQEVVAQMVEEVMMSNNSNENKHKLASVAEVVNTPQPPAADQQDASRTDETESLPTRTSDAPPEQAPSEASITVLSKHFSRNDDDGGTDSSNDNKSKSTVSA